MQRKWETYNYDTKRARWGGYHVTMTPRGEIYTNVNTMKALDAAEHFVLLYDRLNKTIGIKPANSVMPNSQRSSPKGKRGGRWVRAYRLLQQFGISVDKKVRFLQPVIEDGVLILDLRNTTTAAIRRQPLYR